MNKIVKAQGDGIMVNPISNYYFGLHSELNNDYMELEISPQDPIKYNQYILMKLKYNHIIDLIELLQNAKSLFEVENDN